MTPERWLEVQAVLQAALGHDPAARTAFLADACGSDVALRREVESLLARVPEADFLERPAISDFRAAVSAAATGHAASDAQRTVDHAGSPFDSGASPSLALLSEALAGRYAIDRELGRGGMATVYLSRDLRHHRSVAIKVLHPQLSAMLGGERFLHEIDVTASLQHPHILPLFDSGSAEDPLTGVRLLYYVMPLVDGETLRDRLAREGRLPVADAVRIATDVADALDYAHQRGVIHRDVKPENVLLQRGHALVADFGIALAVQQAGGTRMTGAGLSIGTPQYMAPEQASGARVVDARADIYALGAVLFEMLAGEPPFTGPTAQAILGMVMTERQPALTDRRPSVPPHVDAVVRTALEKLPADRFPSAAAFATALGNSSFSSVRVPAATRAARVRRGIAGVLVAAGVLASGVALGWRAHRPSPDAPVQRQTVRFVIDLPPGLEGQMFGIPAISPDGGTIVYHQGSRNGFRLFARRVDEIEPRPVAGTETGDDPFSQPFFSPDGGWVAYLSHGAIHKARIGGGRPVVVGSTKGLAFKQGAWSEDGAIYFSTQRSGELYRVPASGGEPRRLLTGDSAALITDVHPLPGGRALLVTVETHVGVRMGVLDLGSGRVRQFANGSAPHYVAGHIVFADSSGQLYRQPFDPVRLETTGAAEDLPIQLEDTGLDTYAFDVSATGAIVYHLSDWESRRLSLVDRAGRELRGLDGRGTWAPRFSPDGRRIAHGAFAPGRHTQQSDVWITDLAAGITERFTTDARDANDPQWSPDGRSIAYSVIPEGARDSDGEYGKDIVVRALDGSRARSLIRRLGFQTPSDWSRAGNALLFTEFANNRPSLWVQPLDSGDAWRYFDPTPPILAVEARVSPDGRWVTFQSNETGRWEVYVQSFPGPGRRMLVSAGGGENPLWHPDGRQLYYWNNQNLIAAQLALGRPGKSPVVRDRTQLFHAPTYLKSWRANYDVSPDGMTFVLVTTRGPGHRVVVALDALGERDARQDARR